MAGSAGSSGLTRSNGSSTGRKQDLTWNYQEALDWRTSGCRIKWTVQDHQVLTGANGILWIVAAIGGTSGSADRQV
jgi:hypothetical protein